MKISDFQFTNPYLVEMYFVENSEFDKMIDHELEVNNTMEVKVQRDDDESEAKVQLSLNINMDSDSNKIPFKLSVTVAADFTWDESLDEKTVESMLNLNAPALLLGYMRPIVATITNSSAFPVYNIPFINFKE